MVQFLLDAAPAGTAPRKAKDKPQMNLGGNDRLDLNAKEMEASFASHVS